MTDPLSSARAKIERAKKHLKDLETAVAVYFASNPYFIVADCDMNTRRTRCRLEILHEPPPEIACILGDGLHNLRTVLDHLACALVGPAALVPGSGIKFPISERPQSLEGSFGGAVKGASMRAMRLIKRLKPYKSGTPAFWAIHQLDISDKHRLLLTVGSVNAYVSIVPSMVGVPPEALDRMRVSLQSNERWAVDGAVLFEYGPYVNMNPQFAFEMALNEPSVPISEPIIPCLQQFIDFTERVVNIFDRRIFQNL